MVWGERVLIVRQDKPKTCGFEGEKNDEEGDGN